MRPHPSLIPHFQLPSDVNNSNCLNIIQPQAAISTQSVNTVADQSIPKRFMYKTAKSSEDYGKYWGADDDLTLLNTIENIFKAKFKQRTNKVIRKEDENSNKLLKELNFSLKSNAELKLMISSLQNQLESEQKWSQKLELYIKQHFASSSTLAVVNNNCNFLRKDLPNISLIDEEVESNV